MACDTSPDRTMQSTSTTEVTGSKEAKGYHGRLSEGNKNKVNNALNSIMAVWKLENALEAVPYRLRPYKSKATEWNVAFCRELSRFATMCPSKDDGHLAMVFCLASRCDAADTSIPRGERTLTVEDLERLVKEYDEDDFKAELVKEGPTLKLKLDDYSKTPRSGPRRRQSTKKSSAATEANDAGTGSLIVATTLMHPYETGGGDHDERLSDTQHPVTDDLSAELEVEHGDSDPTLLSTRHGYVELSKKKSNRSEGGKLGGSSETITDDVGSALAPPQKKRRRVEHSSSPLIRLGSQSFLPRKLSKTTTSLPSMTAAKSKQVKTTQTQPPLKTPGVSTSAADESSVSSSKDLAAAKKRLDSALGLYNSQEDSLSTQTVEFAEMQLTGSDKEVEDAASALSTAKLKHARLKKELDRARKEVQALGKK